MNLTEWILASAVVLLWMYAWGLSHRIGVLGRSHEEHIKAEASLRRDADSDLHKRVNNAVAEINWLRKDSLEEKAIVGRVLARLDKLDPPRRRATDKKAAKR